MAWDVKNSIAMSWLNRSLEPNVGLGSILFSTAKEKWKQWHLPALISIIALILYDLRNKVCETKQQ